MRRGSVELLIKDEKQQLGLGAYRVKRYRAVVRYLHLVDVTYACLTRLGLKTPDAQGHKKKSKRVLHLPSIRVEHKSHFVLMAVDAADALRNATTKSSMVLNSTLARTVRFGHRKIRLVCDNARFHNTKAIQAWLEVHADRITIFWLPSYCLSLNLIERL